MATVNFMLQDLSASALGFAVWAVLGISQGYLIGYSANTLRFRSKTLGNRLLLAMMLSVSIVPVLNHLICAAFGMTAMTIASLSSVLLFIVLLVSDRKRVGALVQSEQKLKAPRKAIAICIFLWCALEYLMICDLQFGSQLYFPSTSLDYLKHVAITDAICRSGVPPTNPMYSPGELQPLFYYYFWHLGAANVAKIMGSAFDARAAVLSGAVWTSLVLIAAVAYSARYFRFVKHEAGRLSTFAVLLLLVGNLYIFVYLPLNAISVINHLKVLPSIIAGSQDTINPFTVNMFWVPHHVAAFVSMLTCIFLYKQSCNSEKMRRKVIIALLSGICAASTVGQSIYLGLTLAGTFAGLFLIAAIRRSKNSLVTMIAVGLTGIAFAVPFLRELVHSNHHHGTPVEFAFRQLDPLPWLIGSHQGISVWLIEFLYFPWSFLFGMGFVLAAAVYYWKTVYGKKIGEREEILLVMFAVSMLICTFLRSAIVGNDLGWRATIPGLFACLIWSANYMVMVGKPEFPKAKVTVFLKALIVIGLLNLAADFALTRFGSMTFGGAAFYDARAVYDQLNRQTKVNSIVQHNPIDRMIIGNYSHRQVAASDDLQGFCFGPTKEEYSQVASDVKSIFLPGLAAAELERICSKYHIDFLVIRDSDPIWNETNSPVWNYSLIADRHHAKAVVINREQLVEPNN